jgi:hypothetical protein
MLLRPQRVALLLVLVVSLVWISSIGLSLFTPNPTDAFTPTPNSNPANTPTEADTEG